MKSGKRKWITKLWMIFAICISVCCFGTDSQAATVVSNGIIPCEDAEDTITWELDDQGVLTIAGRGTMQSGVKWENVWEGLDKSAVFSVQVLQDSEIKLQTCEKMFCDFQKCKTIDLAGVDTSLVTTMAFMFWNCGIQSVHISKWNTANVTNMSWMFYSCGELQEVDVSDFDTTNVTNMSGMFYGCSELKQLDVTCFDTTNVTSMSSMFYGCSGLKQLDVTHFNTSNVTTIANMFNGCKRLMSVDVSGFDTRKVTNLNALFGACYDLTTIDVSHFDTSNVTDMNQLFALCTSVQSLDLSKWDMSKVTDTRWMFASCVKLETIDMTNWDTGNVKNMRSMFEDCHALEKVDVSDFDTGKVGSMESMFADCYALTEIDVSGFDTSGVTEMRNMFRNGHSLEELDLSTFDTSRVRGMNGMFQSCYNLTKLDLSGFDMSMVNDMGDMFTDSSKLACIVTPKYVVDMELPVEAHKLWVDDAKNMYETNPVTFTQATTLYFVNEIYAIHHNYLEGGKLNNPQTEYKVREGLTISGSVDHPHAEFENWYFDADYTQPATSIEPGTYGEITLYARMIPNIYQITYKNIEGASGTENILSEYAYGSQYELPIITKTCYRLAGWFLDAACTQELPCITQTTSGDLVIYAKWEENHDIDRDNGKVITPATVTTTGIIQYLCRNCTYTVSEEIPKLGEAYAKEHNIPESTLTITDETITNAPNDDDIKGSGFGILQARATKSNRNTIRLKWTRVKNADGYIVYGNKCGNKNPYKKIKTISKASVTSYTHKKLNGKKLSKGTYYKYIVRAYKEIDGEKVTIAASKTVHATTTGGKYGNAKSVKVKTDKKLQQNKKTKQYTLTIKKNKKYTIKASEVKDSKKINMHRKIAFESGNPKIATVTKKGVVTGKKKGTCYIYVYAQNGVFQKIKVKVQ